MPSKEPKDLTVFWINPLKGQMKKVNIRWRTLLLGLLLVILGIGAGIGGVLWYNSKIKCELGSMVTHLQDTKNELAALEIKKKEQELRLEELAKKADEVIQEMNQLRELDQKVRDLLEKDLRSQLKNMELILVFLHLRTNYMFRYKCLLIPIWIVSLSGWVDHIICLYQDYRLLLLRFDQLLILNFTIKQNI